MAEQGELLPGQLFAGDFEIVEPLAAGGMGALYVARQQSTGALRALKLMHRDLVRSAALREKFEREARIGARIESDHVAQVLAAGVDAATGMPWIAMELLRGETLAARVAREGTLSWRALEPILAQMCHALGAAHRQGIVHRDLKPENVFLATPRLADVDLMVKVLDFGIAKVIAESTSTQTGVIGTPVYMAPEQYQGRGIGPRTDVWALGLIAFHVLTGKTYWRKAGEATQGPAALMYEVCMEELVPATARARELGVADRLPDGFDAWFARCVARDPEGRYADAAEVLAGMRASISGTPAPRISSAEARFGKTVPLAPTDAAFGGVAAHTVPADLSWAAPPEDAPPPKKKKKKRAQKAEDASLVPRYEPPKQPRKGSDRSGVVVLAGLGALMVGALVFAIVASQSSSTSTEEAESPGPSAVHTAEAPGGERAPAADKPAVQREEGDDKVYSVPVGSSPVRGNPSAPVTIVEISEFQCPFCKRVQPTLERVRETYGDKVRFVWKHNPLPFHKRAEPASEFALEARAQRGDQGFWAAHDALFAGQPKLEDADLDGYAASLGLDVGRVRAAIVARKYSAQIAADQRLAGDVGASGTPTFFINGRKLVGAQPFEAFQAAIDRALAGR